MKNMELYEKARSVPAEACKSINAGRLKGMTDINPMWRIKRLTELFGPCGVGWWYEVTDKRIVDDEQTKQRAAFVDILLRYIDPETGTESHGIFGTGGASFVSQERNGAYLSDECFKMALTDAISVAAKALGVGADIYFQKDRDKYTAATETAEKQPEYPKLVCEECSRVIVGYKSATGRDVTPERHIALTKKYYGKALCKECAAKARDAAERAAAEQAS